MCMPMDGVKWKAEEHLTARPLRKDPSIVMHEKMVADLKREEICPRCYDVIYWDDDWGVLPSTARYGWRKKEKDGNEDVVDA